MSNFLIVGLKKSGISVANLLNLKNETVFAFDSNKKTVKDVLKNKQLNSGIKVVNKLKNTLLKDIDTIVLSPGVNTEEWQGVSKEFGIEILSEIEVAYRFCKGDVVAITGTNGKTTTTLLLDKILNDNKIKSYAVGNVGNAFSNESLNIKENEVAVCEVSSFQLENIVLFKPKCVGFLNLQPDHLDRYLSFEKYKKAKANVFKNLDKKSFVAINYDDDNLKEFYSKKYNMLFFSVKTTLPKNVDGAYLQKNEIVFVKNNEKCGKICLNNIKLVGAHNIYNIMCACLLAGVLGVKYEDMQNSVETFNAPEHRIEFVENVFNVDFYNDSKATNIASSLCALNAFSKDIFLIMGGSDKGENFANFFANLPTNLKHIYVYGKTSTKILKHATMAGFLNISAFKTLEEAFKASVLNSYKNSVILFSPACASFDQFKNFEERGIRFKGLVRELMNWKQLEICFIRVIIV